MMVMRGNVEAKMAGGERKCKGVISAKPLGSWLLENQIMRDPKWVSEFCVLTTLQFVYVNFGRLIHFPSSFTYTCTLTALK
jgi:hypothetical protein